MVVPVAEFCPSPRGHTFCNSGPRKVHYASGGVHVTVVRCPLWPRSRATPLCGPLTVSLSGRSFQADAAPVGIFCQSDCISEEGPRRVVEGSAGKHPHQHLPVVGTVALRPVLAKHGSPHHGLTIPLSGLHYQCHRVRMCNDCPSTIPGNFGTVPREHCDLSGRGRLLPLFLS